MPASESGFKRDLDGILADYSRSWQRERSNGDPIAGNQNGGRPVLETPVADDGYDDEVIDDVIAEEDTLNNDDQSGSTNSLLRESFQSNSTNPFPVRAPAANVPVSSASVRNTSQSLERPVQQLSSAIDPLTTNITLSSDSSDTDSLVSQHLTDVSSLTTTPRSGASFSANLDAPRFTAFQPVTTTPVKRHIFDTHDVSRLIADEMESVNTSQLYSDVNKEKDFDEARSDSGVSDSTLDDHDDSKLLSKDVLNDIFEWRNFDHQVPKSKVQVTAYPVINGRGNNTQTPTRGGAPPARPLPSLPPDDSVLEAQQLVARYAPSKPTDPIEKIIEVNIKCSL